MMDYFAGEVAETYDSAGDDEFAPHVIARTADTLRELAGDGPVLEFAIGTGRIAVPLHERGVEVHGIDLSPDMIAQLHAKTCEIPAVVGDIATTRVAGEFSLVYLVFNTIGNLTTQDAQVACFANAARHLAPGGRFVIETLVPALQQLPLGETDLVFHRSDTYLGVDEYDLVTQRLVSHHYDLARRAAVSVPFRYTWPAELDLMARLAGLTPEHRWADWDRSPFTALSRAHVSVWRRQT